MPLALPASATKSACVMFGNFCFTQAGAASQAAPDMLCPLTSVAVPVELAGETGIALTFVVVLVDCVAAAPVAVIADPLVVLEDDVPPAPATAARACARMLDIAEGEGVFTGGSGVVPAPASTDAIPPEPALAPDPAPMPAPILVPATAPANPEPKELDEDPL